ncbi:hypothetical protein Rcae01_03582 [Novipirellula caenicola]|uniref:Uncharacterized protein n=1 Tax=Novipirellula caenicola TaxID=1536901 RepID=A0ABP9VWA4_9BACT
MGHDVRVLRKLGGAATFYKRGGGDTMSVYCLAAA